MNDTRRKNANWLIDTNNGGTNVAILAVLMDLRDELQGMRRRLDCWETLEIPRVLRAIRKNTAKPRKKKK